MESRVCICNGRGCLYVRADELSPVRYWWAKFSGDMFSDPNASVRKGNQRVDEICAKYDDQAQR